MLILVFLRSEDLCVAMVIWTVDVAFTRCAVEMVFADHCVLDLVDRYCQPLIEDIHHAVPVLPFCDRVLAVCGNAAVELSATIEPFTFQPSCEFLTADTAGAVCQYAFALKHFTVFINPFRQVAESFHVRTDGTPEVAHVIFISVPGIKNDRIVI